MEVAGQLSGCEGRLPPDLQEAAEALHRKIVSAFGIILLTHYFLETVIPAAGLTPHQAWLVALLRIAATSTGTRRSPGRGAGARWVRRARRLAGAKSPKTIWEWCRDERDRSLLSWRSSPAGNGMKWIPCGCEYGWMNLSSMARLALIRWRSCTGRWRGRHP